MLVKVCNLNTHPYREKFIGQMLEIPAQGHVEMDEDDAERLLASFTPPKRDGQERPDPKFFKMLKIVREPRPLADVDPFLIHATGHTAKSEEEYKNIVKSLAHLLAKDPDADSTARAAENKQLKKENRILRTRLEIIEEKLGLKGADDAADLQPTG